MTPKIFTEINKASLVNLVETHSYPIEIPYSIIPTPSFEDERLLEISLESLKNGFARINSDDRKKTAVILKKFVSLDQNLIKNNSINVNYLNEKTRINCSFFNDFFYIYESMQLPSFPQKKKLFFNGTEALLDLSSNQEPLVSYNSSTEKAHCRLQPLWMNLLRYSENFVYSWIKSLDHLNIIPKPRSVHDKKNDRVQKYILFSMNLEETPSISYFLNCLAEKKEIFGLEKFLCNHICYKDFDREKIEDYVSTLARIPYKSRKAYQQVNKKLIEQKFSNSFETLMDIIRKSNSGELLAHEGELFRQYCDTPYLIPIVNLVQSIVYKDSELLASNLKHVLSSSQKSTAINHLKCLEDIARYNSSEVTNKEKEIYVKIGYYFVESYSQKYSKMPSSEKPILINPIIHKIISLPNESRKKTLENINQLFKLFYHSPRISYNGLYFYELIEPIIEASICDADKTKFFVEKITRTYD